MSQATEVVGHETDEDLYPADEDEHAKVIRFVQGAFEASEVSRRPFEDRWKRYYKLYRSYVSRSKQDWRSKLFIPIVFYTVETVTPRLVAQLPKFIVNPVGPEDVEGAEQMEQALEWCATQSKLYLVLVDVFKSALLYGAGVAKTYHGRREVVSVRQEPQMLPPATMPISRPVMDPESGGPLLDPDGNPVTEQAEVPFGPPQQGPMQVIREKVPVYDGPAAESVDLFHFWVAPEASSLDDARYVIQRYYRDSDWIREQVDAGIYRWPEHLSEDQFYGQLDDPKTERLVDVGLDGGNNLDTTRRVIEVLEVWRRTREGITVTHVADRRFVLRVARSPYAHGEFPYIRVVDHYVPHEFYGIGEVEPLEGVQDGINALWNQRVDNIKLQMNAMYLVDESALLDRRELASRPGGMIRVQNNNGLPLEQVIARVDMGDVTGSAYTEVGELERMAEKISGATAQQGGQDSPLYNPTATGAAILSEQGNSRFSHKLRVAELTGLVSLARQYGSNLQQFMPGQMSMRVFGPETIDPATGQPKPPFSTLTPESIRGAFDYDIASESSTVTESMRKDQDLGLFQMFGMDPFINPIAIRDRVLRTFGIKDVETYLMRPQAPQPMLPGLAPENGQMAQMGGALG